jgi:hypothetical protein
MAYIHTQENVGQTRNKQAYILPGKYRHDIFLQQTQPSFYRVWCTIGKLVPRKPQNFMTFMIHLSCPEWFAPDRTSRSWCPTMGNVRSAIDFKFH